MTTKPVFGGECSDPVFLVSWLDYVAINGSTAIASIAMVTSPSTNKAIEQLNHEIEALKQENTILNQIRRIRRYFIR